MQKKQTNIWVLSLRKTKIFIYLGFWHLIRYLCEMGFTLLLHVFKYSLMLTNVVSKNVNVSLTIFFVLVRDGLGDCMITR